jgi:hypothetical protein
MHVWRLAARIGRPPAIFTGSKTMQHCPRQNSNKGVRRMNSNTTIKQLLATLSLLVITACGSETSSDRRSGSENKESARNRGKGASATFQLTLPEEFKHRDDGGDDEEKHEDKEEKKEEEKKEESGHHEQSNYFTFSCSKGAKNYEAVLVVTLMEEIDVEEEKKDDDGSVIEKFRTTMLQPIDTIKVPFSCRDSKAELTVNNLEAGKSYTLEAEIYGRSGGVRFTGKSSTFSADSSAVKLVMDRAKDDGVRVDVVFADEEAKKEAEEKAKKEAEEKEKEI